MFEYFWQFSNQNRNQIDVVFSIVFGTDFSSIFWRCCRNVVMTNIHRKCSKQCILECFLHVALVGLTSLIYTMLATTSFEIQHFCVRIFIIFWMIFAPIIVWRSISIFDTIYKQFWLQLASLWAPLSCLVATFFASQGPGVIELLKFAGCLVACLSHVGVK